MFAPEPQNLTVRQGYRHHTNGCSDGSSQLTHAFRLIHLIRAPRGPKWVTVWLPDKEVSRESLKGQGATWVNILLLTTFSMYVYECTAHMNVCISGDLDGCELPSGDQI